MLQPEYGLCQQNGSERDYVQRIGVQMKKCWWSLFVWMMDVIPQGA